MNLDEMLSALEDLKKLAPKKWADMTAAERVAEALSRGAEVKVSDSIDADVIMPHKRSTFLPEIDSPSEEYVIFVGSEQLRDGLLRVFSGLRGIYGNRKT